VVIFLFIGHEPDVRLINFPEFFLSTLLYIFAAYMVDHLYLHRSERKADEFAVRKVDKESLKTYLTQVLIEDYAGHDPCGLGELVFSEHPCIMQRIKWIDEL
jgi:Zn-dependent protease with chaperone function